jgi:hypothetical protein
LGFSLPYQGSANIPKLDLNWPGGNSWTGDDTGVVVTALLSGEIDINLSATLNFVPISVNPTLTLTNLPVTITFGTDMAGNATVSQSQVVIAPVGSYGSVNNCGAFGWCNGLVTGPIASQVQAKLQSVIASQFASALNGQNNSSPFWVGFMNAIANSSPIQLLTDPAGYKLPLPNQSTPGGATDKWFAVGNFSYAGHSMTADFFSDGGLCYLDCTPKSQSQLCGPNGCGTIDDGCGDTVTCPGVCGTGQICTKNMCKVCVPLTCANVGTTCGTVSDGCFSTITCNKCGVGYACRNGQCVGFGGQGGQFCANCRATGGICSVRPGNTAVCIHQ